MKLLRRAKYKLKALENSFWKSFFPLVIKGKYLEFPSSLPGHYNLKTEDGFFKLVVKNKAFFRKEAENISKIKASYPEISKIIPNYSYKELLNGIFLVRKTQILTPIEKEEEAYRTAGEFLYLFRKYGTHKKAKLDDLHHLKEGLEVIHSFASHSDYEKTKTLVDSFLKENIFSIGFCHGDFHSKNLMKDESGSYLIDLDCVRENSLQELDAIYFIIQKIIDDTQGIWWYEATRMAEPLVGESQLYQSFLQNFLDTNKIRPFMLIYFLDRVGQDLKYLSSKDELPKKDIMLTLNCLVNEE